jgi:hypothetical protein
MHIRQYPVGKYRSSIHPSTKEKLGFRTLITPSKDACKKHQLELKRVIQKHKYSHQALLIKELNPIVRGWTNYYQFNSLTPKLWGNLQGKITFCSRNSEPGAVTELENGIKLVINTGQPLATITGSLLPGKGMRTPCGY